MEGEVEMGEVKERGKVADRTGERERERRPTMYGSTITAEEERCMYPRREPVHGAESGTRPSPCSGARRDSKAAASEKRLFHSGQTFACIRTRPKTNGPK